MKQSAQINPDEVVVLVLSGGRGTRLRPLTRDRAKSAVGFGGKYRLIDIPLTNCLSSGFEQIYILTQFNSFSLNRHIWQTYSREGSHDRFIDVIAAEQTTDNRDWFQGTADAVRRSLNHVLVHKPRYVMILSGDQIYSLNLIELLKWHVQKQAEITIAGHYADSANIHGLGVIHVDRDMWVRGFLEKPDSTDEILNFHVPHDAPYCRPADKPYLCSMGIYLFNTDCLIDELASPESDFGKSIIPQAAQTRRMSCFPFDGYWKDVGTIEAFYQANMDWRCNHGIAASLHSAMPVHDRRLPPARLSYTLINDAIIADGCHIRAECIERSIISTRSRIDKGTKIYDSIVLGNALTASLDRFEIGKNCEIHRAILDRNCVIGDGVRMINQRDVTNEQTELYTIRSGIIVIPRGAVIPPGTII